MSSIAIFTISTSLLLSSTTHSILSNTIFLNLISNAYASANSEPIVTDDESSSSDEDTSDENSDEDDNSDQGDNSDDNDNNDNSDQTIISDDKENAGDGTSPIGSGLLPPIDENNNQCLPGQIRLPTGCTTITPPQGREKPESSTGGSTLQSFVCPAGQIRLIL